MSARFFSCCIALSALIFARVAELRAEPKRILVVDIQKVINQSIQGKAARNDFEGQVKKSELRLSKIKAELERLAADLSKQSSLLSAEARESKSEVIRKRERDLQEEMRAEKEELSRKYSEQMAKVLVEIRQTVKEEAAEKSYPVVVERDPQIVLYAGEELDISGEIVKRLEKKKLGM